MHIYCTQENMKSALTALERVVGKQGSLPILSNILIETKNGQLQLSATNLEIGVTASIGVKIESEGKISVPAKLLSMFINNLPNGQVVELSSDDTKVFIKSGRYQAQLKGLDAKDFPIIPTFTGQYDLSLPVEVFREAIQKVLFCISLNESRVELTGVYIQLLEKVMTFAATDSFRLGEYKISLQGLVGEEMYEKFRKKISSLLVPSSTLQEIIRITQSGGESLDITVEDHQLFIRCGGIALVSRLLQGRYPDYQQIIPKTFKYTVTLKKEMFLQALKMSNSFSLLHSGEVTFTLLPENKTLVVSSESQDVGMNEISLEFEGNIDEKVVFIFNPRYLLEGVSVLSGDNIHFLFNTSITPVLFQEDSTTASYLYIVMPIRK